MELEGSYEPADFLNIHCIQESRQSQGPGEIKRIHAMAIGTFCGQSLLSACLGLLRPSVSVWVRILECYLRVLLSSLHKRPTARQALIKAIYKCVRILLEVAVTSVSNGSLFPGDTPMTHHPAKYLKQLCFSSHHNQQLHHITRVPIPYG